MTSHKLNVLDWDEIKNWLPIIMIISSVIVTYASLKSDIRSISEKLQTHDQTEQIEQNKQLGWQARVGQLEIETERIKTILGLTQTPRN